MEQAGRRRRRRAQADAAPIGRSAIRRMGTTQKQTPRCEHRGAVSVKRRIDTYSAVLPRNW